VKKENELLRQPGKKKNINIKRFVYSACLMLVFCAVFTMPVFASSGPTVWDKATEIMKDVYNQILLISTIAAIVTAAVALLLMNFSKSGKTVDESRSWLKRIIITWVILNGLGFIMAYVTPFFSGGQWNP
jgi:heme/copper-type cytochrome/quinol oxidase subunit 2